MKRRAKAELSKLKFALGLSPRITGNPADRERYIPTGYKAVFLLSADFELAWAFRYSLNNASSANSKAARSRENIPKILKLCEQYDIPLTWYTVGHLFLEKCSPIQGIKHPEIKRLPFFNNRYWSYQQGDWFDADPASEFKTDPAWYAPDLIEQIIQSPVEHELGCHTFSHIDCRDGVCSPEVFRSEITECLRLAAAKNISLTSFVHPGHTIGNLEALNEFGFTSYRSDYGSELGFPEKRDGQPWQMKSTTEITLRQEWSEQYHIQRYKKILQRSVKANRVACFWFHPSFDNVLVARVLPEFFSYLNQMRDKIWITTVSRYIDFIAEQEND